MKKISKTQQKVKANVNGFTMFIEIPEESRRYMENLEKNDTIKIDFYGNGYYYWETFKIK